MKVKNQGCIRRLSIKTVLAARKRNTIAVLAIALTALLFTSLFTIVLFINETNQGYQFRSVGTSSHGSFKEVTEDQIAVLSAHPKVKATGIRTVIGLCTSGAFEKDYGEVSFMEDNTAKWSFAMPAAGRMPKTGREVAMDTKVLAMLGITPELGAQVDLTYTLADQTQRGDDVTDTFTLVGWWDYDERMAVHYINISREYAQEMEARAIAAGMHPFRTDLNVMLGTSMNIEDTLTRIGEDCGYTVGDKAGQLRIGVNWGYTYTQLADTMDAEGLLAMAAILILVTFTGYLVIYNIFQISVAGDIRYYGLLKTIGVTPRQLRRMIRQQALLLCAFGIPLGLLLGYGIGVAVVPVALSATTYESKYTVISISPWIFLFAAVFALLTVLLSCARPGRIAGNVSPVEAVRYTEVTGSRKRRRSSGKVSPASMAWANLGRNKKKTALVVLSLSLAVALLNMLATFLGGFDMDKYLSHRSCADFIVSTPDYFRYQGSTLTKADVDPIRANTERSLEGFAYQVGSVQMYLPENIWREEAERYLRGMDIEEIFQRAQRDGDRIASASQAEGLDPALLTKLTVIEGDLSPMLEPDNHAVAIAVNLDDDGTLSDPERYPAVGEQVRVTFDPAGARSDVTYTVCALVDVPYSMSSRFGIMGYETVLAADTLRRDAGDNNLSPLLYLFDTPDADAEAAAESYLSNLTASSDSPLMYESKASHRAYFRQFQSTFAILGGLLCAIIGIVGVLNFVNAMMTSILSRQREFAVLQAIGMTGSQLQSMLIWEGLLYTLGAGLVTGLLSAAVNPLAGKLLENAYWFYTYRFCVTPVLILVPVFALLGAAIPAAMYRQAERQSIVERLRRVEG